MDTETVNLDSAMRLVHASNRTLVKALRAGEISAIRHTTVKQHWAIDLAALIAWNARRKPPPPPAPVPQVSYRDGDPRRVLCAVADACGVPVAALTGPDRTEEVARARQIAMAALVRSGLTISDSAHVVNRHHSTVVHGLAQVARIPAWQLIADACADGAIGPVEPERLHAHLAYAVEDYPPADARAVTAYVRGTLLCHTIAPGPLCAHGLWLLATQPRLYRVVVDRLTRSGYGADAGRIDYQIQKLGYRRSA